MQYLLFFVILLLSTPIIGSCFEYTEGRAENNCKTIMDLFIVLDSSGSIGPAAFEQAKNALTQLISRLQIGEKKVQVWVINYGDSVEMPIAFHNMPMVEFTKENLIRKIKDIPYMNGACTATGSALSEARKICDKRCRAMHEGVSRVMLVLSDGNSNCGTDVGIESTNLLHITKANVFAIGIGSYINMEELQTIATDKTYTIHIDNYSSLPAAINNITLKTCGIPAFVVPSVKVESEVPGDTYRYYQVDTTELIQNRRNNAGGFIEIIANVVQGSVEVYTSTTVSNPTQNTGKRALSLDRGAQQYYIEYIDHDTPRLYFSFYGIYGVNQYDFVANWLDTAGSSIG